MGKQIFQFNDPLLKMLMQKAGISYKGIKLQFVKALLLIAFCWFPLAIMTLVNGTFWTGNISTSFITNFDTQVRFLISLPIFILAQIPVSSRLENILDHFINSGIIDNEEKQHYNSIINRQTGFLRSKWTNLAIVLICYIQVFIVLFYESSHTSFLSWQLAEGDGKTALNMVGKWSTLVSRPIVLFFFYKWLIRILVWGNILRKISNLNINLIPEHPDLAGGLGFLGFGLRYFSPITFAISAAVAGNMADFMLIESYHIADLKLIALGYFFFITLLFVLPLFSFTSKMINAKESNIFDKNDLANGLYRKLRIKITKENDQVEKEDLDFRVYSSVSNYNAVVDNVLKMKLIPFKLMDLIPLWIITALPFVAIALLEIPFVEIIKDLVDLVF